MTCAAVEELMMGRMLGHTDENTADAAVVDLLRAPEKKFEGVLMDEK